MPDRVEILAPAVPKPKGQLRTDTCGLDPRQRLDPLLELHQESARLRRLGIFLVRERKLHGEHVPGRESRIDLLELGEAPEHQARAGQEHKRQSQFRHHQ